MRLLSSHKLSITFIPRQSFNLPHENILECVNRKVSNSVTLIHLLSGNGNWMPRHFGHSVVTLSRICVSSCEYLFGSFSKKSFFFGAPFN